MNPTTPPETKPLPSTQLRGIAFEGSLNKLQWIPSTLFVAVSLTVLPDAMQAQYNYTTNADGSITVNNITKSKSSGDWGYETNGDTIALSQYTGPGGTVTIPDKLNGLPVTRIEASMLAHVVGRNMNISLKSMFSECPTLTNVIIPDSITSIGDDTFNGCKSLASVTIPHNVASIGNNAFHNCSKLTNVNIGSGVTNIGSSAFRECSSLTSVAIPSSVATIGDLAFGGCASLTNVLICGSLAEIGNQAFDGCTSLAKVTFQGNAPKKVGYMLFLGAKQTTVYYSLGAAGWSSQFALRPTVLETSVPSASKIR